MFFLLSNVDEDIPSTAIAALNECHTIAFPILHRLLAVLAVLPISNAESERIFSKVERTLTALRSTMREDRLESLILLQAHRDRLPTTTRVIEYFATSGVHRLNFSFLL